MTLQEILEEVGDLIVQDAKATLKKKNKIATGNLYNSVKYSIEDSSLSFQMEQYGKWVDRGRKPGKGIPVNDLKAWLKLKGIDQSLSYVINKKIREKGIKGNFFFSAAYNKYTQHQRLDRLIDKYVQDVLDQYIVF